MCARGGVGQYAHMASYCSQLFLHIRVSCLVVDFDPVYIFQGASHSLRTVVFQTVIFVLVFSPILFNRFNTSTCNVKHGASFSTNFTFEITNLASANGTYGDGFSSTFSVDNVTNLGVSGETIYVPREWHER